MAPSSLHVGLAVMAATQFHVLNKYQFHVYWVDIQSINAFSLISCPRINNVNSNTCTKWCKTEKDRGIESYNWCLIRIVDTRSTTLYVVCNDILLVGKSGEYRELKVSKYTANSYMYLEIFEQAGNAGYM